MAFKLFIGGLSWNVDDATLEEAFKPYGKIASATVVKERDSGRSKGFGFVEFENDEEGKKAMTEMNGKEIDGRQIAISEARPREDRPRRDFNNRDNSSFRKKSW